MGAALVMGFPFLFPCVSWYASTFVCGLLEHHKGHILSGASQPMLLLLGAIMTYGLMYFNSNILICHIIYINLKLIFSSVQYTNRAQCQPKILRI